MDGRNRMPVSPAYHVRLLLLPILYCKASEAEAIDTNGVVRDMK